MTSIEFLKDWMSKNQYFIGNDLLEAFEQAKEMHKQEIINTWYNGYINQCPMVDEDNCGEKFYKETFVSKGNEES
jgi:hypothetical protein